MHCPYCNTVNDDEYSFCVSCGKPIPRNAGTISDVPAPTRPYIAAPRIEPDSVKTEFPPQHDFQFPAPEPMPVKNGRGLFITIAVLFILVMIGGGTAAYFYFQPKPVVPKAEILPEHLGLFVQNTEKSGLTEIKQTDTVNALDQKEKFLADESVVETEESATFILYSDPKDISITDLKLVPLDSIKDDGTISLIDFHAIPVDGKPAMKRLRVPGGLANGAYVFALLSGNLDEGNHKFWAFRINESKRSGNEDIAKTLSVSVKNAEKKKEEAVETPETKKEEPKRESKVAPPSGSSVAYCNGNNVLLRGSPSLNGKILGKLSKGQRIYIMYYSENYDVWRGTTANWAYIQTETGGRGWVFTPFVYY